jgi:PAS domain-containing protein
MRELARIRASMTTLRAQAGAAAEPISVIEDALQLVDLLRVECAGLQQRCVELERGLASRDAATRQLLESLPCAIVITDSGSAILDVNRAGCTLLARSRAKLQTELLLHFSVDRVAFGNLLREAAHAIEPLTVGLRMRPTDRAPFDARVTVYRDPRAEALQFVWTLTRETALS